MAALAGTAFRGSERLPGVRSAAVARARGISGSRSGSVSRGLAPTGERWERQSWRVAWRFPL